MFMFHIKLCILLIIEGIKHSVMICLSKFLLCKLKNCIAYNVEKGVSRDCVFLCLFLWQNFIDTFNFSACIYENFKVMNKRLLFS